MKGIFVRAIEFLGWELLTYENRSELAEEFEKRNIQIHHTVNVGDFPKIWDHVTINAGSIIGHNCNIGRNTKIEDLVWIGDSVRIEKFTTIGEMSSVDEGSYIGQGVRIGRHAKIGRNSYIGRGAEIPAEKEVITISFNLGKHTVYYWGTDVLQIGCKVFHIDSWKSEFLGIGRRERYSPEQIELYGRAISVVKSFRDLARTPQPAPLQDPTELPENDQSAPLGTDFGLPKGDTVTFGGEPIPEDFTEIVAKGIEHRIEDRRFYIYPTSPPEKPIRIEAETEEGKKMQSEYEAGAAIEPRNTDPKKYRTTEEAQAFRDAVTERLRKGCE